MTYVFDMTTGVWSEPSHGQDERDAPFRDGVASLRLEPVADRPGDQSRTNPVVLATLDIEVLLDRQT